MSGPGRAQKKGQMQASTLVTPPKDLLIDMITEKEKSGLKYIENALYNQQINTKGGGSASKNRNRSKTKFYVNVNVNVNVKLTFHDRIVQNLTQPDDPPLPPAE